MRTLLIEDDMDCLAMLKQLIRKRLPEIEIIGIANNITDGLRLVKETLPELLIVDIELPDGVIFKLFDQLETIHFGVIFTSAHDKYGLKAIRYSALDYLLKPIDEDELVNAFRRAKEKIQQDSFQERIQNLVLNMGKDNPRIALPIKEGFEFVNINDIMRCEAMGNYTLVHAVSERKFVCTNLMKNYEELLPDNSFFRVHNSHIINIHYVKKFHREGRGGFVELEDGSVVEVAYRRKEEFLAKFGL